MRRLFTLAVGIGAGAAVAIVVTRWARRKREAVTAKAIVGRASEGARDLAALFRSAIDEGRKAMAAREAEIRALLPE
ncbi:MAG TPA: hypothetical protein VEO00_06310 [Actinomycetota bacterium]|nr:hypothetical protein [Actinomycetota bacterium]